MQQAVQLEPEGKTTIFLVLMFSSHSSNACLSRVKQTRIRGCFTSVSKRMFERHSRSSLYPLSGRLFRAVTTSATLSRMRGQDVVHKTKIAILRSERFC